MKIPKILVLAVLALMLTSVVPASAHGSGVLVEDQEIAHGNTFTIASLNVTETTMWVVVHHDEDGAPGGIEVNVSVSEGKYTDFNVTFKEIDHDETLWVMLHNDTVSDDSAFDPEVDVPRTKHDEIIQDSFVLSAHGHDEAAEDNTDDHSDDSHDEESPGFVITSIAVALVASRSIKRKLDL